MVQTPGLNWRSASIEGTRCCTWRLERCHSLLRKRKQEGRRQGSWWKKEQPGIISTNNGPHFQLLFWKQNILHTQKKASKLSEWFCFVVSAFERVKASHRNNLTSISLSGSLLWGHLDEHSEEINTGNKEYCVGWS